MFNLIPIPGRKQSQSSRLPLTFLGQFLVVVLVILLFVL
jgi:hypothetical protein